MRVARSSIWIMGLATCACAMSAAPVSLAGSHWVAQVEGVADREQSPRLEFLADGRLVGYTGCNMLSGTWRVEGDAVRLGALAATKRGCLGPAGDVEKRVLAALNEKSVVRVEGAKLVVQGVSGERLEFTGATSNR